MRAKAETIQSTIKQFGAVYLGSVEGSYDSVTPGEHLSFKMMNDGGCA